MKNKKKININIRVSEILNQEIIKLSKEKGLSKSDFIRFLILKEIEKND